MRSLSTPSSRKYSRSKSKEPSVVISRRAYASILAETLEKAHTETGGILLGYHHEDTWYVVESVDPGPRSVFEIAYFEYDQGYVNHLINKISRLYGQQLDLLGLWHRHPGSFDRFSGTDDETNTNFALVNDFGAISGLVNIDPVFRMTFYCVLTEPLRYMKVDYVVEDRKSVV